MRILKFGGTSLANAKKILLVVDIINTSVKNGAIGVVLSAPATVTNNLELMIQKAIKSENFNNLLIDTNKLIIQIITDLKKYIKNFNIFKINNRVNLIFINIKNILNNISSVQNCSDKLYAEILSQGEIFSIIIFEELLLNIGYKLYIFPTQLLSLDDDNNYQSATINIQQSIKQTKSIKLSNIDIILMVGFSVINKKNEVVLLGRNGSDYSASILSACLNAKYCEIWTDVNGIYTADPNVILNAKLLKYLSYNEALTLSYLGAKILHFKTIFPLLINSIPCIIKNTMFPNNKGTIISNNINENQYDIKGITIINNVLIININSIINKNINDIINKIYFIIFKSNIPIYFITQSFSPLNINICISYNYYDTFKKILQQELHKEFINKLLQPIIIKKSLSIVSLVGNNINNNINIINNLYKLFMINKISILDISHNFSQNFISFIIKNQNNKYLLKLIHHIVFEYQKILEVFIIGTGNIGKTLLYQIKNIQHKNLYIYNNCVRIKICGIINTKHTLIDLNGINLNQWEKLILHAPTFSIDKLLVIIKQYKLYNPVIIDCTSSQTIANNYINFLDIGLHIVATNKKANTSTLKYYKKIRSITYQTKKYFLYETNVGAGLPVIKTLQNLLQIGDKIIKFYGILSGSLSFIFGKLEEGMLLSQAVKTAKKMGFTEPDPRIDLSGIDVARKLLILAREIGLQIELKDINIEPVINNINNNSIQDFEQNLLQIDQIFIQKIKKAKLKNQVLRYVGSIDHQGICQVKILSVDITHPLFEIKNGENAFIFYSNYYQPLPLILRGYGAGKNVTAAGILTDLLSIYTV
ncbi:bifunctional aspartate kinase/homoserine dehydrogenase I [Enterobacteriaceae endosymbiont of Neohaemonia nigricornis]|uniref:bifunctional aspartate kinase/homoserine dehydrogenase I n=1 Tax=Enterobacteriaceae endosymbiont of Neohaemonia nigricornis TaxID=2675792 RepID=UPI0014492B2F|nr:bifunctional aspartate kinase/homoserine dehydrogenase I [Enterobacteriaceae endosymbiont of Neohaemonia nigricornis]QJC30557.1 bifunctional aspartate kinase/homoserine dehydrogenase I [Enterobacteriaceae endosymbiont of Neohaemonia nigricornis]